MAEDDGVQRKHSEPSNAPFMLGFSAIVLVATTLLVLAFPYSKLPIDGHAETGLVGWMARLFQSSDGPAQWVMASMSVLATALSAVAVWLVYQTWEQSKLATQAAWKTVEETRRIGEAQTRAYIQFAVKDSILNAPNGSPNAITFLGIMTVHGQSPALNVEGGVYVGHNEPSTVMIAEKTQFFPLQTYAAPSFVNSEMSFRLPTSDFNPPYLANMSVWVCFYITWQDIFPESTKNMAAFRYQFVSNKELLMGDQILQAFRENRLALRAA